jgi:hypothetical protein
MKKLSLIALALLICGATLAQKKEEVKKDAPKLELPVPFKGGIDSMMLFFKDRFVVTPQIKQAKATGLAIFKITVETKGMIESIVVYYADDVQLTQPAIDALKRTNGKWVIPKSVKAYDFIVPFAITYKPEGGLKPAALKSILDYYEHRKPLTSPDQVPLNYATMLPTINVEYQ